MGLWENAATKWVPLVQAAGLLTSDMEPLEVFTLGNKIDSDPVVFKAALALGVDTETSEMLADIDDFVEIVKQMSPEEKAALRKRVSGNSGVA